MFDRENFQTIIKLHMERHKVLKEKGDFGACVWELEKIIELMSEAIVTIFGKSKVNYTKPNPILLEGIKNVTLDDVINPDNTITIDAEGNLKIRK